jgi:hypothetical protein
MTRPRKVWIAAVLISEEIEEKLRIKHRTTRAEVEEAVLFHGYSTARWHEHPDYGERLIVRGYTADQVELIVYMTPIDIADGVWECRTARRLED